jgi:hypothetical protein
MKELPNQLTFTSTLLLALLLTACASAQVASGPSSSTRARMKIDSQLLQAIDRAKTAGAAADTALGRIKLDEKNRALVDIRVELTAALRERVTDLGGTVISESAEHRSIVAWVALAELETLSEIKEVLAIVPAPEPARR